MKLDLRLYSGSKRLIPFLNVQAFILYLLKIMILSGGFLKGVYLCVCGGGYTLKFCMWRSEDNLLDLVLSFHFESPGDRTQAVRPSDSP